MIQWKGTRKQLFGEPFRYEQCDLNLVISSVPSSQNRPFFKSRQAPPPALKQSYDQGAWGFRKSPIFIIIVEDDWQARKCVFENRRSFSLQSGLADGICCRCFLFRCNSGRNINTERAYFLGAMAGTRYWITNLCDSLFMLSIPSQILKTKKKNVTICSLMHRFASEACRLPLEHI